MPRFQLLVRELGKEPRVVAISRSVIIGRSRRADVAIDDEEVGREQFRVGPAGSTLFVEGIGKTNRTIVDGKPVEAGQQITIAAGATIKVGRTTFLVQNADQTEGPPARLGNPEATLVARGPARPGDRPMVPEAAEQTGGFGGPSAAKAPLPPGYEPRHDDGYAGGANTMAPPPGGRGYRPGQPLPPDETDLGNAGMTMNLPPGRPGARPVPADQESTASANRTRPEAPAPAVPPRVDPSDAAPLQTMPLRPGGIRPPAAPNPPAALPPLDAAGSLNTVELRPGQRGAPAASPRPAPASPPPPPPPPPRPAPVAAPRPAAPAAAPAVSPAAASVPTPPRPAPAAAPERPKTVMVSAQELGTGPAMTPDLEAKLHQTMPRLLVKSGSLKRRVRLMRACTKVGRAETADVLLPNESVSEQHAELHFDGQQWHLQDLGSTNGSVVDGGLLRGQKVPIHRNSLLGFGSLRAIFVCNHPQVADDRRLEERALRSLAQSGRLPRELVGQVLDALRADSSQSIPEIVLLETAIEPAEWATAVATASTQRSPLAGLLGWLRGLLRRPGGAP